MLHQGIFTSNKPSIREHNRRKTLSCNPSTTVVLWDTGCPWTKYHHPPKVKNVFTTAHWTIFTPGYFLWILNMCTMCTQMREDAYLCLEGRLFCKPSDACSLFKTASHHTYMFSAMPNHMLHAIFFHYRNMEAQQKEKAYYTQLPLISSWFLFFKYRLGSAQLTCLDIQAIPTSLGWNCRFMNLHCFPIDLEAEKGWLTQGQRELHKRARAWTQAHTGPTLVLPYHTLCRKPVNDSYWRQTPIKAAIVISFVEGGIMTLE